MATFDYSEVTHLLDGVPTGIRLGHEDTPATGNGTFEVEDPATGEVIAKVADAQSADWMRALELADAVRDGADPEVLRSELGDVFLQVLFHAEIAARRGDFDLDDVAQSFVDKMRARAPYLFDGTQDVVPAEEQKRLWELGKARGVR